MKKRMNFHQQIVRQDWSNHKHWAFSPDTGEVIGAPTGNALRRAIRSLQVSDKKRFGFVTRKWIFSHDVYVRTTRKVR